MTPEEIEETKKTLTAMADLLFPSRDKSVVIQIDSSQSLYLGIDCPPLILAALGRNEQGAARAACPLHWWFFYRGKYTYATNLSTAVSNRLFDLIKEKEAEIQELTELNTKLVYGGIR